MSGGHMYHFKTSDHLHHDRADTIGYFHTNIQKASLQLKNFNFKQKNKKQVIIYILPRADNIGQFFNFNTSTQRVAITLKKKLKTKEQRQMITYIYQELTPSLDSSTLKMAGG